MRITVIGSGYVGLVSAAGLSEMGHYVLCVDVDHARVETLKQGRVPFFEPGLSDLLARNKRSKRLSFDTAVSGHFTKSDVYFLAVGTPPNPDGRADLSAVFKATEAVHAIVEQPAVLVVKSTVPVGTCDAVADKLATLGNAKLRVASNPEFLKEGAAVNDFFRPDRVIIGVPDEHTENVLRELYRPLQLSRERIIVMDRRSAELSKYAANAMLAVRISFMNEMARLCDSLGADISSVRNALGSDHRIGNQFLYPGPGFGGSCFPKDISALGAFARDAGMELSLVEATFRVNKAQPAYVFQRLASLFPEGISGKTVAVWGLAFKPETDDVRESPAGALVRTLIDHNVKIHGHDPEAAANFAKAYAPNASYFDNEYDALDGADALVVMTEWRHLRNPDFDEVKRRMRTPKIMDARNIWTVFNLNTRGFEYRGIGTSAGRA